MQRAAEDSFDVGDVPSRICVGLGETKVWAAHLTFGPALKIGNREVLEKRVGFYQSLPFNSASRIGIYDDERRIKVVRRGEYRDSTGAASEVGQINRPCGHRHASLSQHCNISHDEAHDDLTSKLWLASQL